MSFPQPMIVNRKGDDLTVQVHGQDMKMLCDTKKWSCYFGMCDSSSSVTFTFKPKKRRAQK